MNDKRGHKYIYICIYIYIYLYIYTYMCVLSRAVVNERFCTCSQTCHDNFMSESKSLRSLHRFMSFGGHKINVKYAVNLIYS